MSRNQQQQIRLPGPNPWWFGLIALVIVLVGWVAYGYKWKAERRALMASGYIEWASDAGNASPPPWVIRLLGEPVAPASEMTVPKMTSDTDLLAIQRIFPEIQISRRPEIKNNSLETTAPLE